MRGLAGEIAEGDLVLVIVEGGERRREYMFRARRGAHYSTFAGPIPGSRLVGSPWGSALRLPRGRAYLLPPTLRDLMMHSLERAGQVIYPKDLGYIAVAAGLKPGMRVVEAGVGSGYLTITLASVVGCEGRVIGYDIRRDALEAARSNLRAAGLEACADLRLGDVREGVPERGLDAAFLDLPDPWEAARALHPSLKPGAPLVAFVPTYNQVERLASEAPRAGYALQEAVEILRREIEARPGATRPSVRMVAHTGFIVVLRRLAAPPEGEGGAPHA
jgi:tRNA (adenine57-N1/adenine58-N1)-methyltransferase